MVWPYKSFANTDRDLEHAIGESYFRSGKYVMTVADLFKMHSNGILPAYAYKVVKDGSNPKMTVLRMTDNRKVEFIAEELLAKFHEEGRPNYEDMFLEKLLL